MRNRKEYERRRDSAWQYSFYDSLTKSELTELRLDVKERTHAGEKPLKGCGIRATVEERGERKILTSYYTIVAEIKGGTLYRLWDGWSATTAKHISMFCQENGVRIPTKYEWIMTDVGDPIKYVEV